ncbi:RNA polymerase sigma factor [Aliifodinibius salicampi]|uniref:RNA polymerase sigma factor n=1 Tax=Fodinibius salicampi TaxID=1920655 RepID=A0ABT3PWK1_9BACT|nr:RNA polymerase sigma factor [Fodinibius salicampi]MCW9712218.1 RNA polymerase sigma factor [Fodinibius salicampi]
MVESIQPDYTCDVKFKDDPDLWQSILEGERDAFELLFQKYFDDLFHYALKLTGQRSIAEDHVQGLFLYIWQKRGTLKEVMAVKTYLWAALRRRIIDSYRKKKTERKYLNTYHDDNLSMQLSSEELIINDEQATIRSKKLKKAIEQLSSRECEVLYLKFYEGMNYQEIEQIMSVNYQTCRNYTYRAIEFLRKTLHTEVLASIILAGLLSML